MMLAMVIAMAAGAAQAGPTEKAADPQKAAERKMICRNIIPTGTRFPKKVCNTRREIEAKADADQAYMKGLADNIQVNTAVDKGS